MPKKARPLKAAQVTVMVKPESFWQKEVRLFKSEMAGWSLPKSAHKELKASNKKAKVRKTAIVPKDPSVSNDSKFLKTTLYVLAGLFLTLTFAMTVFAAGVYAHKASFVNRAYYGTIILGQDVGGKDLLEVSSVVEQKAATVSLSFTVDGQKIEIKPVDAGVNFNSDGTAIKALRKGKDGLWYTPWLSSANSLLYKLSPELMIQFIPSLNQNFAIDYSLDEQKLATLTQNLSQSFNVQSQNAGLVMKGTEVQVIPAVYGKQIITDSIKLQIAEAVKAAESANIAIEVEKVNPAIVEADTQKSIVAAKAILDTQVHFHYQGKDFIPDKETVAGWIIFNTQKVDGKDQLVPAVDARLVYPYIYSVAAKINIAAVNKKVVVTNGAQQKIEQEGKDGLAVDVDAASLGAAKSLTSGKSVDIELPTYAVKAKTTVNNVTVADWSKYVDINLSTQTMCAYLAGGDQQACWSITSGATAKGYYTPTGTFLIQRKVFVTSMPNPPSPEPLKNIHYVSYFTSAGHAIHEAWWRSSFGGNPAWNGSHGCVNAPINVAKWIYDWAPIGTPIIIHY